jgi:hypothetical protein
VGTLSLCPPYPFRTASYRAPNIFSRALNRRSDRNMRSGSKIPDFLHDIVPFKVTLEFADAAALRKFLSDRLFKAREKKFEAK